METFLPFALQFALSDDHFEQLRSDAYDLGTVSEDCELEGGDQYGLHLPPYEQVLCLVSLSVLLLSLSLHLVCVCACMRVCLCVCVHA